MRIQIINGPNINLLGKREPGIYGSRSFLDYYDELKQRYPEVEFHYYQSNIEGEMINKIHEVGFDFDGIILNAGAYTHTSLALQDALRVEKVGHPEQQTRLALIDEVHLAPLLPGGAVLDGVDEQA